MIGFAPMAPGHSAILSYSSFFKAQVERWQHKRTAEAHEAPGPCQIVLTLQHEEQLPAAVAVLKAVYSVQPLCAGLSQEQQLDAALLADMWALPEIASSIVKHLVAAAKGSDTGLSEEATAQLLAMQAYPDCLLPLLQPTLLSRFGDLEAVWADAVLQKYLLGLSLPAMEVLLSCDELRVASEDTVLYTAQEYGDKLADPQHKQAAQQRLAPLIRCQHLSLYWLSAVLHSPDAPRLLLHGLAEQLKQLLLLRLSVAEWQPTEFICDIQDAPASWPLGQRASKQVSRVDMVWELEVSALKEAAQRSAREQEVVEMPCPCATPPLHGLAWQVWLKCFWDADASGSTVGLYVGPANAPTGTLWHGRLFVAVAGGPAEVRHCLIRHERRHKPRLERLL